MKNGTFRFSSIETRALNAANGWDGVLKVKNKFTVVDGGIEDKNGCILYPSDSIEHLSEDAKIRLAEIHSNDESIAYEESEKILVAGGLFDVNAANSVK